MKKSNIIRKKEHNVRFIADTINEHCDRNKLFWAGGLIKDTLAVWKKPLNRARLNRIAQNMVDKLEEDK